MYTVKTSHRFRKDLKKISRNPTQSNTIYLDRIGSHSELFG